MDRPSGPFALAARSEWAWTPEPGKRKYTLSRGQVAWALANAYLRPGLPWGRMDWSRLAGQEGVAKERLRCLLDYFERVERECDMTQMLEYEWVTRGAEDFPADRIMRVDHVEVHEDRMENGNARAIVDFANSKLHIHSIIASVTQEELIFSTCSECFLGLTLFTEEMGDLDCIIFRNMWRHADYAGYLRTFRYNGYTSAYVDVIAIDALPGGQWVEGVERDLRKAYLGFSSVDAECISTGNWGCGAFGGNPILKLLQQTLAAQWAGKRLRYSTFGNAQQALQFRALLQIIANTPSVTFGWMLQMMSSYYGDNDFEVYMRSALMLNELTEVL